MSDASETKIGPLADTVAATVRAEMARHKVKPSTMANALGYNQPKMARRLASKVAFELDELPTVAAVLGMRVADLLTAAIASYEAKQAREVVAA